MERARMDADRRRARDSRAVLALFLGLAMAANLVLAHGLATRDRTTVLVPAVGGPEWQVGESRAGRRYLEDAARTAASLLLTLTPESAGHAADAAARMSHASARGAIGAWVAAEAARMARRDLSTAFYPGDVEIGAQGLVAVVSGELATWIGREEASRKKKRYRLAFRIDGGRLGLLRFEELED